MRKTVVVLVMMIGLCSGMSLSAAEKSAEAANSTWTFYSVTDKPTAEELASVSDGEFGKEATCLYNQLEKLCVKRVPVVPGDPTTRIVSRRATYTTPCARLARALRTTSRTTH